MSYLSISSASLPAMRACTISLWFRIPKSSIERAAAQFDEVNKVNDPDNSRYGFGWSQDAGIKLDDSEPPHMAGIIPLIVFGKEGRGGFWELITKETGTNTRSSYFFHQLPPYVDGGPYEWLHFPGSPQTNILTIASVVGSPIEWDTEPSYIGVWCTADPPRAVLAINLSMGDYAIIEYPIEVDFQATDLFQYERDWRGDPTGTQWPQAPRCQYTETNTFDSTSWHPNRLFPETECFRTHPRTIDIAQTDGAGGVTISPDAWHHLILSFDLTTLCKTHGKLNAVHENPTHAPLATWVDSAPKMWIAIDDANKQGSELSYYSPKETGDDNRVLTPQSWRLAGQNFTDDTEGPVDNGAGVDITHIVNGVVEPKYNYEPPSLQMGGYPMGIPAPSGFVKNIYEVEMAELQIFAGIASDTSDERVRSAFIKDHKPVSPTKKSSDADPVSGSIEFFGREPDVLLHWARDWIKGNNTGLTETVMQFDPTGEIIHYKPDLKLYTPPKPTA